MKHFLLAVIATIFLLAPLAAQTIYVTAPIGGQFCINGALSITWSSSAVTPPLSIKLRPANAPSAPPVKPIEDNAGVSGSTSWTIPADVPPGLYQVRVRTVSDNPLVYTDSAVFEIKACVGGAISVTVPPADPSYCVNGALPITWSSSNVKGPLSIKLRPANAPTAPPVKPIQDSAEVNGSTSWTIPADVPVGQYQVRVRTVSDDPLVYADSAAFEIKRCGSNVVTKHKASTKSFGDLGRPQTIVKPNLILCDVAPGQLLEKHMDPNNPGVAHFNFIVNVLNIGNADSKPCWIKVVFGGGAGDYRAIPTIKAGESIKETFIIHAQLDASLSVSYSVWIDDQKQVDESEEGDNCLAGVFSATTEKYGKCSDGKDHFPTN